jgi:hypothetical protein
MDKKETKEVTNTINSVVTEEMRLRGQLDDKIGSIREELFILNEDTGFKFKYAGLDTIKKSLKSLKDKYHIEYGWEGIQIVSEANTPYKIYTFSIRDTETDYRITKSFPIQDTAVKAGLDTYQTAGSGFTYAERYFLRLLFFIDGISPEELAVKEFNTIISKLQKCKTTKDVVAIKEGDYKKLQYFDDKVDHKNENGTVATPAFYLSNQIHNTGLGLEKEEFIAKISNCKTKTEFSDIYHEFIKTLNFWTAKDLGNAFLDYHSKLKD